MGSEGDQPWTVGSRFRPDGTGGGPYKKCGWCRIFFASPPGREAWIV